MIKFFLIWQYSNVFMQRINWQLKRIKGESKTMALPQNITRLLPATDGSQSAEKPIPTHEVVYRQLRDLILFGEIAPGQAVTIQGLTEKLGAGMTPVREAIRRLIAEGALDFQGNRRVCVPQLSPSNIDELIFMRKALDPELARLATLRCSQKDIDELEVIDRALDAAIIKGDVRIYLERNYEFHSAIYSLANAPVLASIADGLWLRFGPSLRVVCGRVGTQNVPDRHKDAIAAMRRQDADAVSHAIHEDVVQGMEVVRQSLSDSLTVN